MLNGCVLHKPGGKPGQYSCRQTDNIVAGTRDYGGTTCHGQGLGLGLGPLLAFEHKYLQICGDQQTLRSNVTPHTHHILPTRQHSEPLVYARLSLHRNAGILIGPPARQIALDLEIPQLSCATCIVLSC